MLVGTENDKMMESNLLSEYIKQIPAPKYIWDYVEAKTEGPKITLYQVLTVSGIQD